MLIYLNENLNTIPDGIIPDHGKWKLFETNVYFHRKFKYVHFYDPASRNLYIYNFNLNTAYDSYRTYTYSNHKKEKEF